MDLSNVKLVVTDMDGTLLNTRGQVSTRFFEQFEELKNQKIHFVAASGRQYFSISEKLASIRHEITIIAENGGIAKRGETELVFTKLELEQVKKVIPVLRRIQGVYVVLCGKNSAYLENNDPKFVELFREYYTKFDFVEDLLTVEEDDIFKIAVYHFDCSEEHIYPHLRHFEKDLQIKVSGKNWLDISHPNANKGFALKIVQESLGISKEETMAFGDFNNDLEMLSEASFSFAMKNAHPNVKKVAKFETGSNDDEGVESVLEKLIKACKS